MHVHTKVTILILFLPVLLLFGCAKAPSCSDETVTKIVMNLAGDQIRHDLFTQELGKNADLYGMYYALRPNGEYSYKEWSQNINLDPLIKETINTVDQRLVELNPQLDAIVVDTRNDETKKSKCGASLNYSNGETHQITYSAQTTEDKQILVRMRFLP